MSASLVGSEMCIRDRSCAELLAARLVRERPPSEGAAGRREDRKGGGPSVSYTHLTLPTICSV
eukprot:3967394-Alexandrium_andersonii.AAC.1